MNDAFTAAARVEAQQRWPSYPSVGFSGADDRQAAFREGAAWAWEQAEARINAVRLIHGPFETMEFGPVCEECSEFSGDYGLYPVIYPCDTIRVIDGEVLEVTP